MKSKFVAEIVAFLTLALVGGTAWAQAPQPVELKSDVMVEKTVTENGAEKKVLVEPTVVVPGDRLVFRNAYKNVGSEAVKDFVLTNPIQAGVELSGEGTESLQVSVDGGKQWGLLATLKVADGKGGERAALPADVTHVRWVLPNIAVGASGTVSFHAIVR